MRLRRLAVSPGRCLGFGGATACKQAFARELALLLPRERGYEYFAVGYHWRQSLKTPVPPGLLEPLFLQAPGTPELGNWYLLSGGPERREASLGLAAKGQSQGLAPPITYIIG